MNKEMKNDYNRRLHGKSCFLFRLVSPMKSFDNKLLREVEKWRGKSMHEKRQNLDLDRKYGKRNNKQSKNLEYKTVHILKIAVITARSLVSMSKC